MATIDLLRRRIAMAQAKADEYEGVVLGRLVSTNPPKVVEVVLAVSPKIDIPQNCSTIQIYIGANSEGNNGIGNMTVFYDKQGNRASSFSQLNSVHRYGLGSQWTYRQVQFSFDIAYIDDIYVLDETNNVYLWKGKNV